MDPIYISRRRNQKNRRLIRQQQRLQQVQLQQGQPVQVQQQQHHQRYDLTVVIPTTAGCAKIFIESNSPMHITLVSTQTVVVPVVAASATATTAPVVKQERDHPDHSQF